MIDNRVTTVGTGVYAVGSTAKCRDNFFANVGTALDNCVDSGNDN